MSNSGASGIRGGPRSLSWEAPAQRGQAVSRTHAGLILVEK